MTTYKEIFGKPVKVLSTDPTDAQAEGQVWYNSTTGTFKTVLAVAAWSSGGALGTARDEGGAAANAVSDAALYFGGYNGSALGVTEEYNGTSWSEQNDLNTARSGRLGGAGTQTAGLCFGGYTGTANTGATEEYNGTSWSEQNDLNTVRNQLCGVGTSTAALAYGGQITPSGLNNTEEYDGTSWTAQNTLNTARYGFSGAGLQTSALAFGGVQSPPTISNDTEEYNGTSWTAVNDMTQPAFNHGGSGAQSAALQFGGQTGSNTSGAKTSATFGYDGTNWSTRPSMGTTRSQVSGSSGTSNISASAFGGTIPPYSTATEEFNYSIYSPIAATWASGGTVPYTSRQNMSFGTQDAAINVGGYVTATLSTAASYDGASWTASPSLNVAARMGGVAGTQTAGLQFGGIQPPGTYNNNMQTWNGSAWADSPYNLNSGSYGIMGCGTQTAALRAGGENPAGGDAWNLTEEYDGSGWTSGNTIPEGKYVGAGNGVQTSALITGGSPSGTSTYEYDGTNWTAGGSLSTSRPGTQAGSAGVSSSSNIVFGGNAPGGVISATEGYDGTSWSTRPSLATGRGSTTGNGTSTAGLMVSGGPPSSTTTLTEEFTGEIPALGYKTLTSS